MVHFHSTQVSFSHSPTWHNHSSASNGHFFSKSYLIRRISGTEERASPTHKYYILHPCVVRNAPPLDHSVADRRSRCRVPLVRTAHSIDTIAYWSVSEVKWTCECLNDRAKERTTRRSSIRLPITGWIEERSVMKEGRRACTVPLV